MRVVSRGIADGTPWRSRRQAVRAALWIWIVMSMCGSQGRAQCVVGTLTAQEPGQLFGARFDADGDVLAVGRTDLLAAVHIYEANGEDWRLSQILASPHVEPTGFGFVTVFDDLIAVAAPFLTPAGAVHLYERGPAGWYLDQTLTSSNPVDQFGTSVLLARDVIIVGAPRAASPIVGSAVGAAHVFRKKDGMWIEVGQLVDPNPMAQGFFGTSIAMDEGTLFVGAFGKYGGEGAVYTYAFKDDVWVFEQELRPVGSPSSCWFGYSMDVAGGVAAIGAPQHGGQDGGVYVFERAGTRWLLTAELSAATPAGPFPQFGRSVAVASDGEAILAGAPFADGIGNESGLAYVFHRVGESWMNDTIIDLEASTLR